MESSKSFEEKFARICAITKTDKDAALAKILDIKAPSVAAARKRKQIPTGWVEKIAQQFNVSADWIFFGRGPMHLEEAPTASEKTPETAPQAACPRCAELEKELRAEREERREIAAESRKIADENRRLWKENADLRERCARLEEREKQGATPPMPEKKQLFCSNDRAEIR